MEAILIAPKDKTEQEIVNNFLKLNGITGFAVSEKMKRYLAGLEMIEIAEKNPKFDISEEEIINMLKEGEEKVYGKHRKESSD
ncbi:MAG TPA: hypothetical protein VFW07_26110 [Parafilimonas sp.]|nr:hypothetical protein [Parafilimonas sp.]